LKRKTQLDFDQSKIASGKLPLENPRHFSLIQTSFGPGRVGLQYENLLVWNGSPGDTLPKNHPWDWDEFTYIHEWWIFMGNGCLNMPVPWMRHGFCNSATKMTESSFFFQLDDFR